MKRYDSIDNVRYDKTLMGEEVWAFNKLDGQNFGVKYSLKNKEFTDFTSRIVMSMKHILNLVML